ncbi:uncharacterized protein LOC144446674 [Glandiceps talaboti]
MAISRRPSHFSMAYETAIVLFAVLVAFTQGAPVSTQSPQDTQAIKDEYQLLFKATASLQSIHKDIYDNFKQVRLNDVDISDDLANFNIEGLPVPQSSYLVRTTEERDVLVLHRDNFKVFQSFLDVMHMEELTLEADGLPNPFHEDFATIHTHLSKLVVKVNSLLNLMGHTDSIDTSDDITNVDIMNNAQIRDLRHVKVLEQLYHYLPSARLHFDYLGRLV